MVWPPQAAWGGREIKKVLHVSGSSGESPNHDALETALSLDASAYAPL